MTNSLGGSNLTRSDAGFAHQEIHDRIISIFIKCVKSLLTTSEFYSNDYHLLDILLNLQYLDLSLSLVFRSDSVLVYDVILQYLLVINKTILESLIKTNMTYKEKQLHFTFCFFNVFRIPNDKHP